jgi:acetoin utilization deacetylase AcuC-like enzyme
VRTGFVKDPSYLLHRDSSGGHPECPERLQSILAGLQAGGILDQLTVVTAQKADEKFILACHTAAHLDRIKKAVQNAPCHLDADTYLHPNSLDAALSACGGVICAVDAVAKSRCDNVFCAVRPPGHHAESNRAMGFCLLNNVAIGARYAQQIYGIKKVFILDWDVHHGNGTQEIFYDDDSVFYFSTHQFPLYPGTGKKDETGKGSGRGFTYNVPMRAGSGDHEYKMVFENDLKGCLDSFRPDLIMISAGFDAHEKDPLAQMNVSTEGFAELTRLAKLAAEKYCKGRLISVLEGGYNLKALTDSVSAHIRVLMHEKQLHDSIR